MNCFKSEYDETCKGMVINGYTGSSEEVVIPDTIEGEPVVKIGKCAFSRCERLTDITIPDSVTYIGEKAFLQCTNLTGITIPDSVTEIGKNVFRSCEQIYVEYKGETYDYEKWQRIYG